MFENRNDAGQQLAEALEFYVSDNPIVLAIPRGGVAVGYEIAKHLRADFSIIVVRKLPFPDNTESGFGAIAEDGSTCFISRFAEMLPPDVIEEIVKEQKLEIARRVDVLRGTKPLPAVKNRTVILVDDGIAMGSTMRAALLLCRIKQAEEIIVASPVAESSVAAEFEKIADNVIILEKPVAFRAVAQAYRNWHDVSDEEVLDIMQTKRRQLVSGRSNIY